MMRFLKWLFRRCPVPRPVIYRSFVANEISSTWLVRCLADPKKALAMIRARYWLPPNRAPVLRAKRQQYPQGRHRRSVSPQVSLQEHANDLGVASTSPSHSPREHLDPAQGMLALTGFVASEATISSPHFHGDEACQRKHSLSRI